MPIHNAQILLRERILHLIEVVSELTDQFQIRIVDDHSTDSSLELAYDLARQFPQISVSEQPIQVGLSRAAEMEASTIPGNGFVFVHDITYPLRASFFRRLWECRHSAERPEPSETAESSRNSRIDLVNDPAGSRADKSATKVQENKIPFGSNPNILNPSDQFEMIQQLTNKLNNK